MVRVDLFTGLRLQDQGNSLKRDCFELRCRCGQSIAGARTLEFQVVRCARCGASRFIFPQSPLPAPESSADTGPNSASMANGTSRLRIGIFVLSGMLCAAIAVGFVMWAKSRYRRLGSDPQSSVSQTFERHRHAGREALHSGHYERATGELRRSLELFPQLAKDQYSLEYLEELKQETRQASILADLSPHTLEEIVRASIGVADDEWEEIFRKRYAGKSVILDDIIHRDAGGRLRHQLRILVLDGAATIDLDRLNMLNYLHALSSATRLFIGFRLKRVYRRTEGAWRIEPEPDSCVLFTDPKILSGLSITIDADLEAQLKRQSAWFEKVPIDCRGP